MVKVIAYIKILRPPNVVMTALAVLLGYWVARSERSIADLLLLVVSAGCAVGFGNVINDICDSEADKINHPHRPIPRGIISRQAATVWMSILALSSATAALLVSPLHLAGCLVPLVLLTAYAFRLKATALAGNVIVSVLVAYSLLFGGLGSPLFSHLLMPAFLAFLLNFCREIVKDIEDSRGDSLHGIITTANLQPIVISSLIIWLSVLYALNATIPFILKQFGLVYLSVVCILLVLHIYWLHLFLTRKDRYNLKKISLVIKFEMLGGLMAIAFDRLFHPG